MKISLRPLAPALVLAASLLAATAAHAQTVIDRLPYTIKAPGLYVLNNNLSSPQTNSYLIGLGASNVTIDFQGHYISGPPGNTIQTTDGVFASEKSNITLKNGTIAYCLIGINIQGNSSVATNSVGHFIDNMRVTNCYNIGIAVNGGLASRIANCQVSQTGYSGVSAAYGMFITGGGILVQNNVVSVVTGTRSYGIIASATSIIRQNSIHSSLYGVQGGKYQDNLTVGVGTPVSGGVDAGGNN